MLDIRIDETDFDRAMQQLKGIPWAIQKAFVPAVSEVMDLSDPVLSSTSFQRFRFLTRLSERPCSSGR